MAAIIAFFATYLTRGGGNPQPSNHSAQPTSQTLRPTVLPSSVDAIASIIASIREPTPDAMVPLCPSASGLASHVSNKMALWLFIQIPDKNDRPARWYVVAKLTPSSDGKWSVPAFQVGNPGRGRPYWLEIFASYTSITGTITAQDLGNDALGAIPLGFDSHPLATVLVHRKDTPANQTCG